MPEQPEPPDPRLSQIETLWTVVFEAHQGQSEAQQRLLKRYGGAVHRYLLGVLRDPHAADDLAQEFALRLVRGDFRSADPERGRFRALVKTAVLNLVVDYRRRLRARPPILPEGTPEPSAADSGLEELEAQFRESWRDELMDRAWRALARFEAKSGKPLHTVLRLRADQPGVHSEELARLLGERLGRPITAGSARKALLRAREKFVVLLLNEVAHSLQDPSPEEIERELIELRLLRFCQARLKRFGMGF